MTWCRGCQLLRVSCTAVHHGRVFALACAVFALLCVPALSRAGRSPVPTPRLMANGPVRAGQVIEIRWDALPPGVPEMELLLSVDGGRHYPIRLTPHLSGHETSWRWKVPNLGVAEARIRLRANVNGVETESEPGSGFAIVFDPDQPAGLEQVHEGEWWDGFEDVDVATGLRGAGPSIQASHVHHDGLTTPRDRLLAMRRSEATFHFRLAAVRAEGSPAQVRSSLSRFRPRRE